jgi:hypothetical protein
LLPAGIPHPIGIPDPVVAAVQDSQQLINQLTGGWHARISARAGPKQPCCLRSAQSEAAGENAKWDYVRDGGNRRRGGLVHDKLFLAASEGEKQSL